MRLLRTNGGGEVIVSFAAMGMVECALVGISTLGKAAMTRGMSPYVFVVYYNALGTLFLLPSFVISQVKRTTPPLTYSLVFKLYLLGLIRSSALTFGYIGIDYSSPTLSSAIGNLVPAFTFILAIIFRMEKIDLRSRSSQAKILGTIISITGGFIVTLYKGSPILITSSSIPSTQYHLILSLSPPKSNWILGGLLHSIDWFLISTWFILQASVLTEYPAEVTVVFLYSFFATIQSAVFTLIAESDLNVWKLKLFIELVAVVYSGVFGSVFSSVVHAWALHKKGPVFVAMFKPLGIVAAVVMGFVFLGDVLHIGSVVGSVIIAVGFYAVMWGKAKEEMVVVEEDAVVMTGGGGSSSCLNSPSSKGQNNTVPLILESQTL